MPGIKELALAFHAACEAADVPYVFIGGIAVMAWGQPRATMDVDSMVRLQEQDVDRFAAALKDKGLEVQPRDLVDAMREGTHVTVFDPGSDFHVDVKVAKDADEQAEIRDGVAVALAGGSIRVASPEDVIVFKLFFASPQDLQDARSVLVRQEGRLDEKRLSDAAARLGVKERLAEMRGQQDSG